MRKLLGSSIKVVKVSKKVFVITDDRADNTRTLCNTRKYTRTNNNEYKYTRYNKIR